MSSLPVGHVERGHGDRQAKLLDGFRRLRGRTVAMIDGLSPEDCLLQSMPDASPVKWHLAHVTWFFETFVLEADDPGYAPVDPAYRVLFNSYYVGVGARHPRAERGLLSRPSLDAVLDYRRLVDERVTRRLLDRPATPSDARHDRARPASRAAAPGAAADRSQASLLEEPAAAGLSRGDDDADATRPLAPARFVEWPGGIGRIGHDDEAFAFDNERPSHRVWFEPFAIASRLVTCGEYRAFVDDGGYARPEWWLSDGWDTCVRDGWQAPLYWERDAATGAGRRSR